MYYRTRTYLAGDWDGDKDAIQQIHRWNEGGKWKLSFSDAHDLVQARDSSLNCTIKRSLLKRLNASKCFVLVVGTGTNSRRAGECCYCDMVWDCANKAYWRDQLSFIEFECIKAVSLYRDNKMDIVILYNSVNCNKEYCPAEVKSIGKHVAMKKVVNGNICWDYEAVKNVLI